MAISSSFAPRSSLLTGPMPLYIYIIAQLAIDWSKGVKFRLIIIDETTIMTEA